MASTRDLLVRIKGDSSSLSSALGKAEKGSSSFGQMLKNAEKGSYALLGGVTAVSAGITAFGVQAIKAYNEQAKVEKQLEAVLKSTGGAAGVTSDEMKALASSLQRVTTFGDEAVISAENLLLTFTNIKGGVLKDATKTVLDMSIALGQDLKSSSIQLGKALNDPIRGVTALQRVGVSFTASQKEQIRVLVESGKTMEAQKLILKELSTEFGGSAVAATQTLSGKIQQVKNAFGDFMELIGKGLTDKLGPLVDKFYQWMDSMGGPDGMLKKLKEKIEDLKPKIPVLVGAIVGGLIPAFYGLATATWSALAPLLPFVAAGALIAAVLNTIADKVGGWGVILSGVKNFFDTVIAKAKDLYEKAQPYLKQFKELWDQYVVPSFKDAWDTIKNDLLPALKKLWDQVGPILGPALKYLAIIVGGVLLSSLVVFAAVIDTIVKGVVLLVKWYNFLIESLKTLTGWFVKSAVTVGEKFRNLAESILGPFKTAFNGIADIWNNTVGKLKFKIPDIPGLPGRGTEVKMPTIPKFQKGIESFEGGLAYVHKGEMLANLPAGTSVISRARTENALNSAQGSPQNVINFNPTLQVGMFAGMPTEYREIAERLWVEFTRIANSNGVKLQPIGVRTQ